MKTAKDRRIEQLGFESLSSFSDALRLDDGELNAAIELCRTSYPYDSWTEPKKSGNGVRLIEHPHFSLKKVQTALNRLLQRLPIPRTFHGCIAGTSIKTNARPHCCVSWFLGLDLADYYQTIRPNKVYDGLRSFRAAPDIARVITTLTTINHHVPQGAPTSPIIAAIALLGLSRRIDELLAPFRGRFSIFGDNLSVSASRDLRRYKNTLVRIVRAEGFRVREDKTIDRKPGSEKVLPGVVVRNCQITVADDDKSEVDQLVSRCRSLGPEALAKRVCQRFPRRLGSMVNHYAWIDHKVMRPALEAFSQIEWPNTFDREPCQTVICHCM